LLNLVQQLIIICMCRFEWKQQYSKIINWSLSSFLSAESHCDIVSCMFRLIN
jgi:hypothetical protein